MKLIEKKCPNCNGDLEFKVTDTEVTCKYCQRSFIIEKDNKANLEDEAFNLVYSNFNQVAGVSRAIFVIVGLFIMGIAIFMFVTFAKTRNNIINNGKNNTENKTDTYTNSDPKQQQTLESLGFVTKYEEIPAKLVSDLQESGINALENVIGFYKENFMPKIVTSWTYVGSYFLIPKQTDSRAVNILYDVYSITYKIDKKNTTYYGVVATSNIKKVDGSVVTLGNTIPEAPKNTITSGTYAFGYISLNSVLNDLVGKKADLYSLEYIGNVSKIED